MSESSSGDFSNYSSNTNNGSFTFASTDASSWNVLNTSGGTVSTHGLLPWSAGKSVEVNDKEMAIGLINARINDLAQKAARLARLREFFETMNSKQNDIIKGFWETVKKELD